MVKFTLGKKMKPVCLVLGAGAGIGGNVAKKFSKEGFHLCICRRTDEKGLNNLVKNIEDNGWEDPPQCMPDSCKDEDVVTAYRNYYIQEKKYFAEWKFTKEPEWMLN